MSRKAGIGTQSADLGASTRLVMQNILLLVDNSGNRQLAEKRLG